MVEPKEQQHNEQQPSKKRQSPKEQLDQRIIALQEWMMHTDHLLNELNEVMCRMQDRLDEQARQIKLLKQSLQRATEVDEERSFEDDRPPHY